MEMTTGDLSPYCENRQIPAVLGVSVPIGVLELMTYPSVNECEHNR
jgi:hypothetical protein